MSVLKKSSNSIHKNLPTSSQGRCGARLLIAGCLTIAIALAGGGAADATSGVANTWNSIYPGSSSEANADCQLCHGTGTNNFNAYGWAIKQGIDGGSSRSAAIQAVESVDSDSDPTGSDNATEIAANTQPGWTPGTNTISRRVPLSGIWMRW